MQACLRLAAGRVRDVPVRGVPGVTPLESLRTAQSRAADLMVCSTTGRKPRGTLPPTIERVPWANPSPAGAATYYVGQNHPAAVVIHRMQGHLGTAIEWARAGHFGASWRWTVGLDGRILQHMAATDGGYHAGIPSTAPRPTWPL